MNLRHLVDTDWAINHLNGQERTRQRLEELAASGVGFSIISLAEVYEGIYYSSDPEANEQALADSHPFRVRPLLPGQHRSPWWESRCAQTAALEASRRIPTQ